jgi:hypothetical protein
VHSAELASALAPLYRPRDESVEQLDLN